MPSQTIDPNSSQESVCSNHCLSRRKLLQSTCVGAAALLSLGTDLNAFTKEGAEPQVGDTFVFTDGPHKDDVVALNDIVVDAPPIVVQAKDTASGTVRDNDHASVLLWRVAPDKVPQELTQHAAQGILAFSAVCTHLGCLVTDWVADKKWFRCPCHEATFDPMEAGERTGGPQVRALPILPLKIQNGKLVVADVFTGTVGPKKG